MAVCQNNFKQLGTLSSLHMDDYDGQYPTYGQQGVSWDDQLSQYDGRNLSLAQMQAGAGVNGQWGALENSLPGGYDHGPLYRCPSDEVESSGYIRISYYPTQNSLNSSGRGIYGFSMSKNSGGSWVFSPWSKKVSEINKTSQTIAFTEMSGDVATIWWARMGCSWGWQGNTAARMIDAAIPHHEGIKNYNFLMADGSVNAMSRWQSLIKDDGSIATITNVDGSKWDSFR
jgi:hypothetical protein